MCAMRQRLGSPEARTAAAEAQYKWRMLQTEPCGATSFATSLIGALPPQGFRDAHRPASHFIGTHARRVDDETYTYGATWSRDRTTVTWKAAIRHDGEGVAEFNGTSDGIWSDETAIRAVKAFVAAAIEQFAAPR